MTPGWQHHVLGGVALALLIVLGTCSSPCAHAQDASVRDTAVARTLFDEGVACADRDDWTCAADRFERAHALRASPVIAYNLGHALLEVGRLVEGAEILRRLTRDPSVPENVRRDAAHLVAEAEPRIGRLTVRLVGPTEDVSVTVGASPLAASLIGTAAPIDPGEHTIEAHRDGSIVATVHAWIPPGGTDEVELAIPPRPEVARAESRPSPSVPAPRAVADAALGPGVHGGPGRAGSVDRGADDGPWIALGVTGALLVVAGAVVLGVLLAAPADEPMPFDGSLGHVELGLEIGH